MSQLRESRQFRYYDFVMAAYVCVLLCSNLIGPAKETSIHIPGTSLTLTFLAGVLFFPISYIFGDILTEVYGYARDRRVVWAGFGALAFASRHGGRGRAPAALGALARDASRRWRRSSATRRASCSPRSSRFCAARSSTATCSPR